MCDGYKTEAPIQVARRFAEFYLDKERAESASNKNHRLHCWGVLPFFLTQNIPKNQMLSCLEENFPTRQMAIAE